MKLRTALSLIFGALAGYGYYYFVGCNLSGSCIIGGNPWVTSIFGAVLGFNLFGGRPRRSNDAPEPPSTTALPSNTSE